MIDTQQIYSLLNDTGNGSSSVANGKTEETGSDHDFLDAYSRAVMRVVEKVGPAVVSITAAGGGGSGSIITPDGFVLTNNHVVEKASQVEVILTEGDRYNAQIVGVDPATDLAVVRISNKENLPTVDLGHSSDLSVGQARNCHRQSVRISKHRICRRYFGVGPKPANKGRQTD